MLKEKNIARFSSVNLKIHQSRNLHVYKDRLDSSYLQYLTMYRSLHIVETGAVFTIGRSRFADNVASHFFIRKDPVVAIECGDEHSAVICRKSVFSEIKEY